MTIQGDPDQLEQALINLIRNAADASLETGGGVRVGWEAASGVLEIRIEDDGPGIPQGAVDRGVGVIHQHRRRSGVGLVLSRKIAERHGGTLRLTNREDGRGCLAVMALPIP